MKKNIKIILCVVFLCTTFGCAKQNLEILNAVTPEKVTVETLKSYMAKLINVKISNINYDEATEQFSIFGINQINRQELTASYERSLK